jgi:AcrR family transcriptional regulator
MTHPPGPPDQKPVRKRDPKGTRDRLVRAALELFTTLGYHASTTPEIAKKAGVAEGTIYRHFASKEQMLNEIYRAGVRLFVTIVKETPMTLPAPERLERIAGGWRDIALRNPHVVHLVLVNRVKNQLDPRSKDAAKELRDEVEKLIASGKSAGLVRPGAVEVWADIWMQLVTLMLERVANKEWTPDQAAPRLAVEAAWAAISGGAPPSPPAAPPPGPAPTA